MIPFDEITAFRLVRRLVVGQDTFAMYLLVCVDEMRSVIEDDLKAETKVQLGSPLHLVEISELLLNAKIGNVSLVQSLLGINVNELNEEVLSLLDTHVVRFERTGAQLL